MQKITVYASGLFLMAIIAQGCQQSTGSTSIETSAEGSATAAPFSPTTEWNAYWYAGKAEITSYDLQQSRYGEIHQGTAVNIFVTEDLSRSKQVKLDDPGAAGSDRQPVLKLNQSIKFNTGIYPYSIMMSAYQPIDIHNYPYAVKLTGSMQEWCGMTYFQLNDRNGKFAVDSRSYFESEADRLFSFDRMVQEDDLMNLIRLDPAQLPTGTFMMLPGAMYLRLSHKPVEPVQVKASVVSDRSGQVYVVEMPSLNRTLKISYEAAFPYRILGWEDTYPGFDGKPLTSVAKRSKEIKLDYWRTHTNNDRMLRDQLGLPRDSQ